MTDEELLLANAQLSGSVPQHNGNVNFAEKKVVEYSYMSHVLINRLTTAVNTPVEHVVHGQLVL
jgi:hypothetical protein